MTRKQMYKELLAEGGYSDLGFGDWHNPNAPPRKRYAHVSASGELEYYAVNPKLARIGKTKQATKAGKGKVKTMAKTFTEDQVQAMIEKAVKDAVKGIVTDGTDNGARPKKKAGTKAVRPYIDLHDEPVMELAFGEDYRELLDRVHKARAVDVKAGGRKTNAKTKERVTYAIEGEPVFVYGDKKRSLWLVMPAHNA